MAMLLVLHHQHLVMLSQHGHLDVVVLRVACASVPLTDVLELLARCEGLLVGKAVALEVLLLLRCQMGMIQSYLLLDMRWEQMGLWIEELRLGLHLVCVEVRHRLHHVVLRWRVHGHALVKGLLVRAVGLLVLVSEAVGPLLQVASVLLQLCRARLLLNDLLLSRVQLLTSNSSSKSSLLALVMPVIGCESFGSTEGALLGLLQQCWLRLFALAAGLPLHRLFPEQDIVVLARPVILAHLGVVGAEVVGPADVDLASGVLCEVVLDVVSDVLYGSEAR